MNVVDYFCDALESYTRATAVEMIMDTIRQDDDQR